jgi:hypothetical protein
MTIAALAATTGAAAVGVAAGTGRAGIITGTKMRHCGSVQVTTTESWLSVRQLSETIGQVVSFSRVSTAVRAPPDSPIAWPVKPATALSISVVLWKV